MMKNNLKLEKLFTNKKEYVLLEDFEYVVGKLLIRIPKGFVTDLASIPKPLQFIFPPDGKYSLAALIHDFLYSELNITGINRKLSDKIFFKVMKDCGVDCCTRVILYEGVRTFGRAFWKNKKINGLESFDDEVLINKTKEAKEYYSYYKDILGF